MAQGDFLFTSESVSEGHPDKIADQISDAVLDAVLRDDVRGHVACETLITTGLVVVSGEISTSTYIDVPALVRGTIEHIGYTRAKFGFDASTCGIVTTIHEQSPDIAQGVDTGGAGDQAGQVPYRRERRQSKEELVHSRASDSRNHTGSLSRVCLTRKGIVVIINIDNSY